VVRTRALEKLWSALTGRDEEFAHLGDGEKVRIVSIVRATVKGLPVCWKGGE
jgi:hypothetical protein